MNNFTFSDFEELSKEEEQLQQLLKEQRDDKMKSPTTDAVSNVLAYSKALSIKKSKRVDYIEHLLN